MASAAAARKKFTTAHVQTYPLVQLMPPVEACFGETFGGEKRGDIRRERQESGFMSNRLQQRAKRSQLQEK